MNEGHHERKPDYCTAPAAALRDWISENGLTIRILSVTAGGRAQRDEAARLITEVMDREPLTSRHAEVLAAATKIPARI